MSKRINFRDWDDGYDDLGEKGLEWRRPPSQIKVAAWPLKKPLLSRSALRWLKLGVTR